LHCQDIASRILKDCLAGRQPSPSQVKLLAGLAASAAPGDSREASDALFRILAEGLADQFDSALADSYAQIFSQAIALVYPECDPAELVSRYHRVRRVRPLGERSGPVTKVFVLSRITLGADVAVTSVLLDAARQRFPDARIVFAAPEKNWRLFGRDARLEWLRLDYGRSGTLRDRLSVWGLMKTHFCGTGAIVIDPDSRLTQLGLLPVCAEEDYFLFDSRSYGNDGEEPLAVLARRWSKEVLAVPEASSWVAPAEAPAVPDEPYVTVNLGVGENPAKRLPDPFESELLRSLAGLGMPLVVDLGAGGEEERRVRTAAAKACVPGEGIRLWRGSFAELSAVISRSRLYVGYDSGGQHVAAALGIPLVTVFAGFASARMFARWTPFGPGPKEVIRVDVPDPASVLDQTLRAVRRLIPGPGA